ncbi:glycoside hydrolase family 2 protein [Chitinophaga vietnamensis]|uniref:glycoside hydrolase family 2 protein n=1 Tax=Chitinophaga vietnamensis TaxID=2593957 RepID=UPI0013760B9E|nr:sugar-binding domain-containing protein [Chitinophaga vietnamensis]
MTKNYLYLTLLTALALPAKAQQHWLVEDRTLDRNWKIRTSVDVSEPVSVLSGPAFPAKGWYPAAVPGTVMGALVADSVYKDVFFDNNMERIPKEPFKAPWWYRTEFDLPALPAGQVASLRFNGINYRADVWVNGQLIIQSDSLRGGFRRFLLNVSKAVHPGRNILLVKVTAPGPGEPTLGFVDWNPAPPDRNMGIWRDVHLLLSGPLAISQPFVQTSVDTATLKRAALTVSAQLTNHSDQPRSGVLEGEIGAGIHLSKKITLSPHTTETVVFDSITIDHPRLWWTRDLGKPELYQLTLHFKEGLTVSDQRKIRFGIRTVGDYINAQGHRGYTLNGKKLLIRGGGWTDRMLLDPTPAYERAGIEYAVHMNLNTIRMEGFWGGNQHLYDLCDEKGLLVMAGWSAAWEWTNYFGSEADDYGGLKSEEQMNVAVASLQDQVIWLRNHPSVFLWVYGSDKLPRPALEQRYLDVLKKYDPTRPALASAHDNTSALTGPVAVKMRGPYDYVPPDYWYIDERNGGAFGFNTETGPGPQVPLLESLRKMIPADSLWPLSRPWMYHAARGEFHNLNYYNNAMDQRLGVAVSLNDYLRKAQYLNYEGMRAMLEAFASARPYATGIIQWMYNASWPKLWWQLYDYYLLPTGAFYGARKAGEPLHIAYNYGTKGVEVINNTAAVSGALTARVRVLDTALKVLSDQSLPVPAVAAQGAFRMPLAAATPSAGTWYLDLRLQAGQHEISRNFYVLSVRADLLDTAKTNWYVTPQTQFADLTALQHLPAVSLAMKEQLRQHGDTTLATLTLHNNSRELAFMVHADIRRQRSKAAVVPVFWEDNDITLLPGESITINGYVYTKDIAGDKPLISLSGWNIVPVNMPK